MKTVKMLAVVAMAVLALSVVAPAQQRGLLVNRAAACNPGDSYFAWDQPAGQNLSNCVEPGNTWVTGNAPACGSYTITPAGGNWVISGQAQQPIASSLTQTLNIAALPANYDVTSMRLKHSVIFAGTGITGLTVSIGSAATGNGQMFATPDGNLLVAPAPTLFWQDSALPHAATTAADTLTATFTATGANLTALTSGTLWFSLCYTTVAQ